MSLVVAIWQVWGVIYTYRDERTTAKMEIVATDKAIESNSIAGNGLSAHVNNLTRVPLFTTSGRSGWQRKSWLDHVVRRCGSSYGTFKLVSHHLLQ